MLIRRIARPLLATSFVAQGVDGLRNTKESAEAAAPVLDKGREVLPDQVSQNIPSNAATVVRINSAVQIGAGALLATGKFPRIAALALAGTLVPTSLGTNAFWNEPDPARKAQQRREFLTGVSLLGGLIITAVDTEGKPSLGWRGRQAAQRATDAVSSALPIAAASDSATREHLTHGLHAAAERGKGLAAVAASRGSELADVARERGPVLAEAAKERGSALADAAREHGPSLAQAAKEHGSALAEAARERGPVLADAAKEHGAALADAAREHGPSLADAAKEHSAAWADVARNRGGEIADITRERATNWRHR